MKRLPVNFYHNVILDVLHGIKSVSQPVVAGHNSRVFIAEDLHGAKTVFRFDRRQKTHRDFDISQVLSAHGLSAPRVSLHLYQGQYFETYPYLEGNTLHEQLMIYRDWRRTHRRNIFAEIAWNMKKIADIPVRDFKNIETKDCSAVAQANVLNTTHNPMLGLAIKYGTMLLNCGEQCVCHCDLTPQNIIWGDNGHITAILDLNAISIANINFAAAITGLSLERYDFNSDEFFAICNDIMPGKMNYGRFCVSKSILKYYFHEYIKLNNK